MFKGIEPVDILFKKAVHYHKYHPIKKLVRYDEDVAHDLQRMAKKTAVQIKDKTFSEKDPMSVVAFLQNYKSAYGA